MTLQARIVSARHELTTEIHTVGEDGKPKPGGTDQQVRDVSLTGQLLVNVEYVDTMAPETVVLAHVFQVFSDQDENAIIDEIIAYGQQIQEARARATQLKEYIGVLFDVPLLARPAKRTTR